MMLHVPFVAQEDADILHEPHDPRQHVVRHVGPAVGGLEQVRVEAAPEPEQALQARSLTDVDYVQDHRHEQVDVRHVGVPGNPDDGGGVEVVVLKAAGESSEAGNPVRSIVENQVDDAAGDVHVQEGRRVHQKAGFDAEGRLGEEHGGGVPQELLSPDPPRQDPDVHRQAEQLGRVPGHVLEALIEPAEEEALELLVGGGRAVRRAVPRGELLPVLGDAARPVGGLRARLGRVDQVEEVLPAGVRQVPPSVLPLRSELEALAPGGPPGAAGVSQLLAVGQAIPVRVVVAENGPVAVGLVVVTSKRADTCTLVPVVDEEQLVSKPDVVVVRHLAVARRELPRHPEPQPPPALRRQAGAPCEGGSGEDGEPMRRAELLAQGMEAIHAAGGGH
mmetsp:Transcript_100515/g.299918  ORF Transcript_100515/g.299918 Transcript_100515/m.299918 type:complete len:390 (+) Transcript_100515:299-1468(+)